MKRFRLSTLLLLVVIAALGLTVAIQQFQLARQRALIQKLARSADYLRMEEEKASRAMAGVIDAIRRKGPSILDD